MTGSTIEVIRAPAVFALEDERPRGEVLSFLQRLRGSRADIVLVDFGGTTRIIASGGLLFYAELDRLIELNGPRYRYRNIRHRVVRQVLCHVGFVRLFRSSSSCRITESNVRYWAVDKGTDGQGAAARQRIESYARFSRSEELSMFRGLSEAMLNCVQHAYLAPRGDDLPHATTRWWMFSQLLDGQLTVAICDLGIGIAKSLESRSDDFLRKLRLLVRIGQGEWNDATGIRAALNVGRSRTKKRYRGKGLRDVRRVVDDLAGSLHILSNRGVVTKRRDGQDEECKLFPPELSILGTIVLWTVPLRAGKGSP